MKPEDVATLVLHRMQRLASRTTKPRDIGLDEVEALARKVGVQIVYTDEGWNDYDGEGHIFCDPNKSDPVQFLLHDIAHYQVASPERRGIPDYGLGPGVDSKGYEHQEHWVTSEYADAEEEMASLLGIIHEMTMGGDWYSTLYEHNWVRTTLDPRVNRDTFIWDNEKTVLSALTGLIKAGLLTHRGRPTSRLRSEPDPEGAWSRSPWELAEEDRRKQEWEEGFRRTQARDRGFVIGMKVLFPHHLGLEEGTVVETCKFPLLTISSGGEERDLHWTIVALERGPASSISEKSAG